AMERNMRKMADHVRAAGKGFRPHSKTHKCPTIAKLQMQLGAVGICAAKISEAAIMLGAGVPSVLITSPIATLAKAQALNSLLGTHPNCELLLVVDSEQGLAALQAAIAPERRLGLLVDIDLSMGRTGTREVDIMLRLIDAIMNDERFEFRGIQHYAGHLMHIEDYAKRRDKSLASWSRLDEFFIALAERGISPEIVTGGGTGTYDVDVAVDRLTDIQVGSYIFMDEEYRALASAGASRFEDFELALTVACSTISQPQSKTITVDGGYKAFASDSVNPVCDDLPGVEFRFAGDEHGVLILGEGQQEVQLGQVLRFAAPHCDPTVNLHDYYWILEDDGLVHSVWPISARGCSW
ncbi:MAG TPA: threonine aldolase, partial [Gammaproteobacteria bacterium]|nr:threonine aldolase [Gammaproteobacteria bacterium]